MTKPNAGNGAPTHRGGTQQLALFLIAALSAVLLVSMLVGGRVAGWFFGVAAMALPVALMALGALRRGKLGKVGPALVVLVLLLEGAFLGTLALAGKVLEAPRVLGLPSAAALFFAAIWLLPLVLVSLSYALTFEEQGISNADLERLRELNRHAPPEDK